MDAVTNNCKLFPLKQHKRIHNSAGRKTEIKDVSSACAPSRGSGEPFPHLFQLLVAPGDSWLVAASLLFCLHLCRAYPHLSVFLFCMFLTRIAVIG